MSMRSSLGIELLYRSGNYTALSGVALTISFVTIIVVYTAKGAEVVGLLAALKMLAISGGWPKLLEFGLVSAATRLFLEKDRDPKVFGSLLLILVPLFICTVLLFYGLSLGGAIFGSTYSTISTAAFPMLLLLIFVPVVFVSQSVLHAD